MAFCGLSERGKSVVFWQTGVNPSFNTHRNGRYHGVFPDHCQERVSVSILAIRRKGDFITYPCGEVPLEPDDKVIVIGAPADIIRLSHVFHPEIKPE